MKKLFSLIFYLGISCYLQAQAYDTTRVVISQGEFEKLKLNFLRINKSALFNKYEHANETYLSGSFACSNIENENLYEKCLYEIHGNRAKKIIKSKADRLRFEKRLRAKYPEIFKLYDRTTIPQKVELSKLSRNR